MHPDNPPTASQLVESMETENETISMPTSGLYVNVDVNDLLETHSIEEVFEFLGKLKDLMNGVSR
jgi:hypothetical protein